MEACGKAEKESRTTTTDELLSTERKHVGDGIGKSDLSGFVAMDAESGDDDDDDGDDDGDDDDDDDGSTSH